MLPQPIDQEQSVFYLTILIVLEILIFIFTLVSQQTDTIMIIIMRLILLIGAQCLKSISWAAFYAVFAFITSLYIFDPVGLWIIGHGDAKTKVQNGFCVICFILTLIAAYLGYIYKRALQREIQEDFVGDANVSPSNVASNDQRYLYRANGNQNAAPQPRQRFEQFAGPGYSLG